MPSDGAVSAALRALLPPEVAVAAIDDDGSAPPPLLAGEEKYVRAAVVKRRREFAFGRACARVALAKLDGRPPAAIPVGIGRAPVWPDAVVGSITHTDGFAAAAVAPADAVAAVGIDAEAVRELPLGVRRLVARPTELDGLPVGFEWDVVAFSAKEAVFKAWFPLTGTWLDFHDVALSIDPRADTFVAELSPKATHSLAPTRFTGRFAVLSAVVIAGVHVYPAAARPLTGPGD